MFHLFFRLCLVFLVLAIFQNCNSSPVSETAQKQTDPTAAISKEIAAVESMIADLENKLHEGNDEHDNHGSATPQEIEILKTLQVLNQRLMQLERMISAGTSSSENSDALATREIVEKQVIDQARKTLSEHSLGGQSFFTAPSLIQTNYIDSEKLWNVSITFKRNKSESKLYVAEIQCQQDEAITCNVVKTVEK